MLRSEVAIRLSYESLDRETRFAIARRPPLRSESRNSLGSMAIAKSGFANLEFS